ncbi:MAG TPA: helix-hairpin-helix domain-containing protein [Ktedonobacterales bacterium]|jgi:DNA polymerase (family 10)
MIQFTQSVQLVPDPGQEIALPQPGRVTNAQVAEVLFNIATLLEMQMANPYRVVAYRNAARGSLALGEPITAVLARGARLEWPGLGQRLRRKITELVTTGRMTFYDDLAEESLPDDVRALMRVPHIGPRIALRLAGQLDIHSVPELLRAAQAHQLRPHYGFGPRSEQRLAAGAQAVLREQLTAA